MTDQSPIRPTPELHNHHQITTPERDRAHQQERPARVETQTQIDRYERRKVFDRDQPSLNEAMAEACRRYFADAYYSGTVPRASSITSDRVDGSCEAISERHVAATQRRRHAIKALGELFSIMEWVCVDDHSAEAWAIKSRQHPMSGITVLRLGSTVLAKHYGLIPQSSGRFHLTGALCSDKDFLHNPKLRLDDWRAA